MGRAVARLAVIVSGSRRRKVRRACAASRCTPAGLTCRAAVTCVKQDHPPRGARLRVPFFHAAPYKRALGSWGGCKRFRLAVVCAVFARQGVKGRSARVFGVYTGGSPWRVHAFARGPSGFQSRPRPVKPVRIAGQLAHLVRRRASSKAFEGGHFPNFCTVSGYCLRGDSGACCLQRVCRLSAAHTCRVRFPVARGGFGIQRQGIHLRFLCCRIGVRTVRTTWTGHGPRRRTDRR